MLRKVVGTILAPAVGVTAGLVMARVAPVAATGVLAVTASAVVTLLLAAVGDRRLAPVAWFSASSGLGVAFASVPVGYGRVAETSLLVVGGVGTVLYLLRLRSGNARRLSALPVDPGPVRRSAAHVARVVVRVQAVVGTVAPTPTHRLLSSAAAGAIVLGTYGYGALSGAGWAAVVGAAGTPLVATLPFYQITDWRRIDGGSAAVGRQNRDPDRSVIDRLEPLEETAVTASRTVVGAVSRSLGRRSPGSSATDGESAPGTPAGVVSAVRALTAGIVSAVRALSPSVGAARRALLTGTRRLLAVPTLVARVLTATVVGSLYVVDEHLLGPSDADSRPTTTSDSGRKRDGNLEPRGKSSLEGRPDVAGPGSERERDSSRGGSGVTASSRLATDVVEFPRSASEDDADDRSSSDDSIGGLTVSERVAAVLENHAGSRDD